MSRKVQLVSLSRLRQIHRNRGGLDLPTGGNFQAKLAVKVIRRGDDPEVERLRLCSAENKDRARQLDECRRGNDERFAHFASDAIDFAKTRLEVVADFLATNFDRRRRIGKGGGFSGRPIRLWSETA